MFATKRMVLEIWPQSTRGPQNLKIKVKISCVKKPIKVKQILIWNTLPKNFVYFF